MRPEHELAVPLLRQFNPVARAIDLAIVGASAGDGIEGRILELNVANDNIGHEQPALRRRFRLGRLPGWSRLRLSCGLSLRLNCRAGLFSGILASLLFDLLVLLDLFGRRRLGLRLRGRGLLIYLLLDNLRLLLLRCLRWSTLRLLSRLIVAAADEGDRSRATGQQSRAFDELSPVQCHTHLSNHLIAQPPGRSYVRYRHYPTTTLPDLSGWRT